MATTRALIFDFIGTLTSVRDYSLETSKLKLHRAIVEAGFDVTVKDFLEAYGQAHEKYRIIRYRELVEVTNAVWVSEALNYLGFDTNPEDSRIRTAITVFFEDYLNSLELNVCAKELLSEALSNYKLGMISNFTYAPVIHAALRKLGIDRFFNAILVSAEVGWRKPSGRIFEEALMRLNVMASETIYVGDSPLEDIKGAAVTGMRTVFVPSQFYPLETLLETEQKPDLVVRNLCELKRELEEFARSVS